MHQQQVSAWNCPCRSFTIIFLQYCRINYVYCTCKLCLNTVAAVLSPGGRWTISKITESATNPCKEKPCSTVPAPTALAPIATAPGPIAPVVHLAPDVDVPKMCCICFSDVNAAESFVCSSSLQHVICLICFEMSIMNQVQAVTVYTRTQCITY